jgi:hypothetical protein
MSEPVTFVVETRHGRESASIVYGQLPEHLRAKGSNQLVWVWRLDKLPNGEALQQMPIGDLYDQFVRMREQGKLPPSNLADPPRKVETGPKVIERGPEFWWKPTPLPRGQDWTPDAPPADIVGFE